MLVKLEYFNPAGSVKDRVAKNMIDEAEKAGKLVRANMLSRYFSEIPCRAAISLSGMRPAAWCSARSTITRRAYLPLVETNMYSAAFRSFSP